MTETTDYNNLTLPTKHSDSDIDEDQWAGILNSMFEDEADELLIKRGTLSDRPAAGNSKDSSRHRMYIAEDQDPPLLTIDSDSQGWLTVNPTDADTVDGYEGADLAALAENETVGGTWTFSNTISGSIDGDADTVDAYQGADLAALAENETVGGTWTFNNEIDGAARRASKTFGPTVNGGHSDFADAQAAIDYADLNGGKTVLFPSGTYGSISIPNGLVVRGSGIGNNSTSFEAAVTGGVVSVGSNAVLEHCSVSNTGTGSGDHGVTVASSRASIRDVRFAQAGGDGFNSADNPRTFVTACDALTSNIGGSSVFLTSNTSDSIVTGNRAMGTITDNGTGNIVTNNT